MQTVKFNASFLICHIQCLPYAKQRKDALIEENRYRREREIGRMNGFAAAFAPFDVPSRKPVWGPRQPPDDPIDLFRWGQSAWCGEADIRTREIEIFLVDGPEVGLWEISPDR